MHIAQTSNREHQKQLQSTGLDQAVMSALPQCLWYWSPLHCWESPTIESALRCTSSSSSRCTFASDRIAPRALRLCSTSIQLPTDVSPTCNYWEEPVASLRRRFPHIRSSNLVSLTAVARITCKNPFLKMQNILGSTSGQNHLKMVEIQLTVKAFRIDCWTSVCSLNWNRIGQLNETQ